MKKFFALFIVLFLSFGNLSVFASSPRSYYKEEKFIIKDNKILDNYDETFNPIYSPDGKGFSFIAKKNNKYILVRDGIESEKYNYIINPTYSPDGEKLSFVAQKNNSKSVVVTNGEESKEYDEIHNFIYYSDDSKKMVFGLKNRGGGVCVAENGIEYCDYNSQEIYNPIYLPKSNDLLYAIENQFNKKFYLMKNGKKISEYPYISQLISSQDGKSFMFITGNQYDFSKEKKYFIIKDDYKSEEYNWISSLTYSPNGKGFTFLAKNEDGNNFIVKDGKKIDEYKNIMDFSYSPDGKNFVFRGYIKSEGAFLVKDGVKIPNITTSPKGYDSYIFSKNGDNFAYVLINKGKYFVVNNGIKGNEYDSVSNLTFSPNGDSLSFIATNKNNYILVKEGKEFQDNNGFNVNYISYSPD